MNGFCLICTKLISKVSNCVWKYVNRAINKYFQLSEIPWTIRKCVDERICPNVICLYNCKHLSSKGYGVCRIGCRSNRGPTWTTLQIMRKLSHIVGVSFYSSSSFLPTMMRQWMLLGVLIITKLICGIEAAVVEERHPACPRLGLSCPPAPHLQGHF